MNTFDNHTFENTQPIFTNTIQITTYIIITMYMINIIIYIIQNIH